MQAKHLDRRPAISAALAVALCMVALPASVRGEGTDPQPLKPGLLAPAQAPSGRLQEHRAQTYRSGLTRSLRILESDLHGSSARPGARQGAHGRLGVQSRINAARREHTRMGRSLQKNR